MKKVLSMVGRMLRGWLALFELEIEEKVELIIQQVESEVNLTPQIKRRVVTLELARSGVQLLEVSSAVTMNQCNRSLV